jgi:long-subunit fatty acid transport protein
MEYVMRRLCALVLGLVLLGSSNTLAQFPEDALRLSTPGFGVGARALGMGGAYNGVASDYSAIYWNPAGLAQMTRAEFSTGLSYLNTKDDGSFFGTTTGAENNVTNVNAFGIVHPVPVRRGSLVLAFGFQRQGNFASGLEFKGFNPNSSIIQSYAPNGETYPSDLSDNLAYQLYLADLDTLTGRFISPIADRVAQSGTVTESGGLNNWSIAGAVDIAQNTSVGLTVTYVAGTYRYDRSYTEEDRNGVYNVFPYDFTRLDLEDFIEGDISGVNAKFGLMYRMPERFRFGVTVKTPTAFTVKETYGTSATARFDDGDKKTYTFDGTTEYDVRTPWVLGAGGSVIIKDLLLSADAEFTDWTTAEFANANSDLLLMNKDIKSTFRSTWEFRFGGEYDIAGSGFRLRAGYGLRPSPYKGDPTDFDRKTISAGAGMLLGGSVMLDLAYANTAWKNYRSNYDATSRVNETLTWNTFLATLSYRF